MSAFYLVLFLLGGSLITNTEGRHGCSITPVNGKVVIPAGTTTVAPSAFYKCNDIVEVVIPASVVEIGYMCFAQAGNLRTVTFDGESQLEQIGMSAFSSTALML